MNTKRQGSIAVAEAIRYYTKQNYAVFTPVSDVSRFDLIVEKDDILLRIEVKSCSAKDNQFMLRTNGGNQSWNKQSKFLSSKDCDKVFLYNINTENFKEVDITDLEGKSTVTFK